MTQTFKSNVCKHMEHEVNFSYSWWCGKQLSDPNEIHKKCDCKNCPDFEAYEGVMETTENVSNSDKGFDYEPYTSMVLEGDYDL